MRIAPAAAPPPRAAAAAAALLTPPPPAAAPPRRGRRAAAPAADLGEDVEVYSINTGWNLEALAGAESLLDDLEGWSVEAAGGAAAASDGEDAAAAEAAASGSEDEDGADADDDDEDSSGMVWSVEVLKPRGGKGKGKGKGGAAAAAPAATAPAAAAAAAPRRGVRGAQRDLLASMQPHVVRRLAALQVEADAENEKVSPSEVRKAAARLRAHRGGVRIIAGLAAGARLWSPAGDQTRPMMEMVRGAAFNMIAALRGCAAASLPEDARWLDLFAGTGAVGIEALSRGVGEAHFVELSPWVISKCLRPNLAAAGLADAAVVHAGRAEDFLRRAANNPRAGGGAFDFVSVCPPYDAVSYPELFQLLAAGTLLHEDSIVLVEYPRLKAGEVPMRLGPLTKVRDRRYGRTLLAIYAAPGGKWESEGEEEEGEEGGAASDSDEEGAAAGGGRQRGRRFM